MSDSLFSIISNLTHPDVKGFLENTLGKNDTVNTAELFGHFGISYYARQKHPVIIAELGAMLRSSDELDTPVKKERKYSSTHMESKPHPHVLRARWTVDGTCGKMR
jgi:hypothetical protein